MRTAPAAVALLAVTVPGLALALLQGDDGAPAGPTVYAAASLREALAAIDPAARLSFAGSGRLQRQIEAGGPADVLAAASPREPAALHAAGRCSRPRAFATNRLAVLVPRDGTSPVESVADLRRPGLRLALGTKSVPAGRAAREALGRLGVDLRGARVSSEPSVTGVVAKVALGSAQAGVGYVTDARAAGARVRALPLPAHAQPPIEYHVCAVRRPGADSAGAERFIARLTGPRGRAALRGAGFGLPR